MDHATVEGNYEHKLIPALNRSGLRVVKLPAIAEYFFDN